VDIANKTQLETAINNLNFDLERMDNNSDTELVRKRNDIERMVAEFKDNNTKIDECDKIVKEIQIQIDELNNNQGKSVDEHKAERDHMVDNLST